MDEKNVGFGTQGVSTIQKQHFFPDIGGLTNFHPKFEKKIVVFSVSLAVFHVVRRQDLQREKPPKTPKKQQFFLEFGMKICQRSDTRKKCCFWNLETQCDPKLTFFPDIDDVGRSYAQVEGGGQGWYSIWPGDIY